MRLSLDNAQRDPRVRDYVTPKRLVWRHGGAGSLDHPERLLDAQDRSICTMKNDGDAPGILLDFGREIHGGVAIRNGITGDQRPVRVRVRFGESVSEAMGEPNNDHAVHDLECLIPWYGTTEIGNTGFRFVRIDLVDSGRELQLEYVKGVFLYHDLPYQGSFKCNDDRLNTIWQTGAYTVHLCLQDMLWDGIKRDRLVWIGDMHPETMVVNTVFGHTDIVPQSLDFVRDDTPLPRWMNGISSYSLWWVLIHHCWYQYHGDLEYLREQRAYLEPLLQRMLEQIGDGGREHMEPHRFLDWPSSEDQEAIHGGLQGLLTWSLDAGADLCDTLGMCDLGEKCRSGVERMRQYQPPPSSSKQANALLALAGYDAPSHFNDTVLAVDPFRGLSTFYGYYVLQARALAGDYVGCLEAIRTFWGKMLDMGATTFWEDFNLDWTPNAAGIDELVPEGMKDIHADFGDYCYKGLRHSLCHGWAAGPTAWMSQHVLGIAPAKPGFEAVTINPNLGDLEFAEGTFPTPYGTIEIRHEKDASGDINTEVVVPEEVEVVEYDR